MRKQILRVLSAFLVCFCAIVVNAQQNPNPEVLKILGISVEGNHTIDAGAIILASGLKQGESITLPGEETMKAIRALWDRHLFSDIQILTETKINDGVYLLIRIKEYPRLHDIIIEGNDELDESKIKEKIPFVSGQVVSTNDLNEISLRIKKIYEEDGYLLADIKPQLKSSDSTGTRADLIIKINEGQDVRVYGINFEGNKEFSDGDLRGQMDDTIEKKWWKFWRSNKFDRKKYEDDKKKITDYYKKNGYRDAEILKDTISYNDTKKEMYIKLTVIEGQKYHIRNINWVGNTLFSDTLLSERLGLKAGELYNAEKLERNLRQNEQQTDVSSLYMDIGYLRFNVVPEEVPVSKDSLDMNFRVLEGKQFRVAHVDIKGNTKTRDKVIRRELYTYPGDIFRRNMLMESFRRIQQLNYFNPEKIKPDVVPTATDSTIDVTFEVQEKSSDQLNAQVGYSHYYGMVGAVGFTFTNFSATDPLAGGQGQQLDFNWQFGEGNKYSVFSVGFTEPWLYDSPTTVGISFSDTKYNYYTTQNTTSISGRIGRRFQWPDNFFQGNWTVSYRNYNILQDTYGYYSRTGKFSQFGISQVIERNSKDSPIFPTTGSSVTLLIDYYGGPLFPGNSDYIKTEFTSEWLTPLLRVGQTNRMVLFLHSELGFIQELSTNTFIDWYELYRMGGGGLTTATIPLRGYDDQTIGPKENGSTYPSGKIKAKFTAELRYSLSMDPIPIHLLTFVEAGNVWRDLSHTDPLDLYRSAGVGVRLLINPIGLVGFDYGYGFDNPDGVKRGFGGTPSGWKFHFQFGRGM
jgi:outer membrane protein insertion porin family